MFDHLTIRLLTVPSPSPQLSPKVEMTFCIGGLKDFELTILKRQSPDATKKKQRMISTAIAVEYEGPGQDYYLEVPRKDLLDFYRLC